MPPERQRSFPSVRPVKTERTHEENQERAYIAASRRSDRSLEARIESARRASEIHKKRTGRALRVTEQDVINEEMYEEEDDDLPTQYQRLNAHINSSNIMFNKKLQDYIATQQGVRSMFMSQYQTPSSYQPMGFGSPSFSSMPPPQFGSTMGPGFQQAPPYSPTGGSSQSFRQAPYQIPQRAQPHQRSMSIQLPNSATTFDPAALQTNENVTTPQGGVSRRLSLPPQAFGQTSNSAGHEGASQAMFSPSSSVHSPMTPGSNAPLARDSSRLQSEADTPVSLTYSPASFPMSSQMFSGNPLTLSLPPEAQQLIGSALDPNDPHTAILMSGSNNLAQPFTSNYTYNPNAQKQASSSNATGATSPTGPAQTLSTGINMKLETAPASNSTSISEGLFSHEAFLTPGNGDYNAFFDFSGGDFAQGNEESNKTDLFDSSTFVNWD